MVERNIEGKKDKIKKDKQKVGHEKLTQTTGGQVQGADAQLPADELLVVFEVEVL